MTRDRPRDVPRRAVARRDPAGREGSELAPGGNAPVRRRPARVDETLGAVLQQLGLRSTPTYERVLATFREQAEPGLRQVATATRFRRGELVIEVRSAAHAQELANFTGEALRARINAALGSALVTRLVIKHQVGR